MELKTLKDIEKMGANALKLNAVFVEVEELKAEAVKWVKEIRNQKKPKNMEFREWRSSNYGAEEFIKHFFNLTEGDLK